MTAVTGPSQATEIAQKPNAPGLGVALTWLALILGIVLRIARFVHFRSLWLDEIYLANSIVHRSLHDLLFKPLEDWQAAPAGYLFLVHIAMSLFGTGERALRLVSFIFGLISLPLMWGAARRLLSPWGVAVALAMFSVLGPLIYYCTEVKPYSGDVAASLAIVLSVMRWDEKRTLPRATIAGIVGAIGVFLSYPAIFVLAGAGGWILVRRSAQKTQFALILLTWIAAFVFNYFLFVRPYTTGEAHWHVVQYWIAQDAFMPRSFLDAVQWLFSSLNAIARSPGAMWIDYPNAALIGLIIGIAIALRTRSALLLVLAPLPVVILAAAVREYPFGDRLALFFVPSYLLLIAAAAQDLWRNLAGKAAAIAIVGLIVVPSAQRALGYLFSPHGREESLPIYQWAAANYQPGDSVYLSHYAKLSFDYYADQTGWPVDLRKAGLVHVQQQFMNPAEIKTDADEWAKHGRVWVVLIHPELGKFDEQSLTIAEFDQVGKLLQKRDDFGASGYLYDCTHGSH
jgi:hypothetical protein